MQSINLHQNPAAGPLMSLNSQPLLIRGTSVPADGTAGYPKGCMYIKTNGGVGSTMYINEGSETSCDFNSVT